MSARVPKQDPAARRGQCGWLDRDRATSTSACCVELDQNIVISPQIQMILRQGE